MSAEAGVDQARGISATRDPLEDKGEDAAAAAEEEADEDEEEKDETAKNLTWGFGKMGLNFLFAQVVGKVFSSKSNDQNDAEGIIDEDDIQRAAMYGRGGAEHGGANTGGGGGGNGGGGGQGGGQSGGQAPAQAAQ